VCILILVYFTLKSNETERVGGGGYSSLDDHGRESKASKFGNDQERGIIVKIEDCFENDERIPLWLGLWVETKLRVLVNGP
jgi:hypothetical protein